ncbi:MAG: hypothetical protein RL095_3603 [Verrucomicrobiota bacterium]
MSASLYAGLTGLALFASCPGVDAREITAAAAIPAPLPATYLNELNALDADALPAAEIAKKLEVLAQLQTPACRDALHRRIAEARHPSRYLPLLKAFPGATSFRIVLPYYQARPDDFGELLMDCLAPDCAEAIEEAQLEADKNFLTLVKLKEFELARWLHFQAVSHPEAGPLWRLPELRQIYASAAKNGELAPIFFPEFPPALHRTLRHELKLDPSSPLGRASLARSLGANWAQFHRGGPIWTYWAAGERHQAVAALKICLDTSALPTYDWRSVCIRLFRELPAAERSAWAEIAASYNLLELIGPAQAAGLLHAGEKKLLLSSFAEGHEVSWPDWLAQALAVTAPEKLHHYSPQEEAAVESVDWEKLPKTELKNRLLALDPRLRYKLARTKFFPDFDAAEMIEIFGLATASYCVLNEVDLPVLKQLLDLPRFDQNAAGINFKLSAAAEIEELLLSRSLPFYTRQSLLYALDQVQDPSVPSILRRLNAGIPVLPLPEETLPTLLKHLETQPIDLLSLRLAQNLWAQENAPDLPIAFLDRLEKSVDALDLNSLPFALALLRRDRPDSPQIRQVCHRLIESLRFDLYDARLIVTWGLIPEGLPSDPDQRAVLELHRRLNPEALSAHTWNELLPGPADPALNEEALQLLPATELLAQFRPLSSARQEELRPAHSDWQRARLASSLGTTEAPEIYKLLKSSPELLALLPKRTDWPQLRQSWEKNLRPDNLQEAQSLVKLDCRLPQAVWIDILPQVKNESELLLLLRLASAQPPLAPELEAALSEALEHSRNRDFFYLNHRRLPGKGFHEAGKPEADFTARLSPFAWPDPAADAQDQRLWQLKCRLAKKHLLSPFLPPRSNPDHHQIGAAVSRFLEAPYERLPECAQELRRVSSKSVSARVLVRALIETDDPRRLRALLKELPAELNSAFYRDDYISVFDLRALSFWVATGIIPETEVPVWLRPWLSGGIFSEQAQEYHTPNLLGENGPRRVPEWTIVNDRLVFSPAAPAPYAAGDLSTLWPFLSESLRSRFLLQVKDEALRAKLEKIPLRQSEIHVWGKPDDPEEAKRPN